MLIHPFAKNIFNIAITFLQQIILGYLLLTVSGIIFPITYNTIRISILKDLLQSVFIVALTCAFDLFAFFDHSQDFLPSFATVRSNLTLNNVVNYIKKTLFETLQRILIGIVAGSFSGIFLLTAAFTADVLWIDSAPDPSLVNDKIDFSLIPRTYKTIHAPIIEEISYRLIIMTRVKLLSHIGLLAIRYAYAKTFLQTQPTEINDDILQEDIQEAVKSENKVVNVVSNTCASVLFMYSHLPEQRPYAFCTGLMFGNLAQECGGIVPSIVAHMTHNTVVTTPIVVNSIAHIINRMQNRVHFT